ncbi:hypothetical protein PVK06_007919 [Gossypium arboreum]|uniref:Uncharacterized protein n=1 Tax=Gossypium arboreum TaxID=29729 RepID=A0ABR0QIM7_GOSAR|nr:hypothetical protein PVK06_007919 [Gossypium arboreum]
MDVDEHSEFIEDITNEKRDLLVKDLDIEECLRKIDSLFEDGIFADQEDTIVEKEVAATEEEVVVEEEEQDRARLAEAAEVTSEEKCNSLAIEVYTEPFQVASPTQEAADDVRVKSKTEEQSEDRAKPKKKKKKRSKDKNKRMRRRKGGRNIVQPQ